MLNRACVMSTPVPYLLDLCHPGACKVQVVVVGPRDHDHAALQQPMHALPGAMTERAGGLRDSHTVTGVSARRHSVQIGQIGQMTDSARCLYEQTTVEVCTHASSVSHSNRAL